MGKRSKTEEPAEPQDPAVSRVLEADNLFEVLDIDLEELEAATEEAADAMITKKYRTVSLSVHPDRCRSSKAADAAQIVNLAHEKLSDAGNRRQYIAAFKRGEGSFKAGFNVHHTDTLADDIQQFVNEVKSQFKSASGLQKVALGAAMVVGSVAMASLFLCSRTPFHHLFSQTWLAYIIYGYLLGNYGVLSLLLLRLPGMIVVVNLVLEGVAFALSRFGSRLPSVPELVQAIPTIGVRVHCETLGPLYAVMMYSAGYRGWLCVVVAAVVGVVGRLYTRAMIV